MPVLAKSDPCPVESNFSIVSLPRLTTNRLPNGSNASPVGFDKLEFANIEPFPRPSNFTMLLAFAPAIWQFDTNRVPPASKAKKHGRFNKLLVKTEPFPEGSYFTIV